MIVENFSPQGAVRNGAGKKAGSCGVHRHGGEGVVTHLD